jgi:hypothetical protein
MLSLATRDFLGIMFRLANRFRRCFVEQAAGRVLPAHAES